MTWNEQNKANSICDVLEGTVEEWYDQVDGLLKASDFIPGNYEYSINVAYANAGDFQEGGQTHVDISCDRFKLISLDNSYIDIKMNVKINKPALTAAASGHSLQDGMLKGWYVGFKNAFDAIDQYRIYSNSDLIMTQNHANYEGYLQYMAASDVAKENSELYATWDKVQKMSEDVPGVYITSSVTKTSAATFTIPFDLRIPLNQFLMLANLKWFPSFFGKLTLEIYPSYKNLVICPILAPTVGTAAEAALTEAQLIASADVTANGTNMFGFRQINTPVLMGYDDTTSGHAKSPILAAFTCNESETQECHIRLAETVVRMDVYNQIMTRFVNKPMLFPIQTIISKDFGGSYSSDINVTMTNALNHCNSMFIVFKRAHDDRTCFENPLITWQVNIDGKYFPRDVYKTFNDKRNMNLFLDATNFNGNGLFSVPNDIYHSLQPYVHKIAYSETGAGVASDVCQAKDRSNFAIGIPFCDDDTFQAGLHTGGTVQVELRGAQQVATTSALYSHVNPTGLYVEDCILKLRAVKPSGEPQISFTHATPEQLLASAVVAN